MTQSNRLIELAGQYPDLKSTLSDFLRSGGEQLLQAVLDEFDRSMWPWDRETHVQASYGAFCSGVAWSMFFLRNYNRLAHDRAALSAILAAGSIQTDDRVRDYLKKAGYPEAEIDAALKGNDT